MEVAPTMASSRSLQEVALAAVNALRDRKAFRQVQVAERMNTTQAAVSETLAGKRRITLRFMEAVAEVSGLHPAELLIDPHRDQMKVVSGIEMQLLRYFRSWPSSTRMALLSFASFFADEDPVTHDERRAHEQIRRLSDAKKRLVYGYLTFLTEGDLPRDVRIALGLPETDAPQSTRTEPTKRRTTTRKQT